MTDFSCFQLSIIINTILMTCYCEISITNGCPKRRCNCTHKRGCDSQKYKTRDRQEKKTRVSRKKKKKKTNQIKETTQATVETTAPNFIKSNTEEGLKRSSLQPHPRHHFQWKASIETNHKASYSFFIYGQLFFCIYVLVLLIILYFCIAPC